ncbi:SDR family oxidoreductase [Mucilaginibacter litoreus]|uniref:SDR family oxidoreductase n=1 Tax=Mucilaginibacter litoreus TaxID=1048221 RepID=A0ABW3AY25_9SPHI
MKYTITGSTGNISKPLTQKLLDAGHQVRIITSRESHIAEIEALGAETLTGSILDTEFLSKAFAGADAVYTMIPPKMDADNWQQFIYSAGRSSIEAAVRAGVKKIVNLSSMGAHLKKRRRAGKPIPPCGRIIQPVKC